VYFRSITHHWSPATWVPVVSVYVKTKCPPVCGDLQTHKQHPSGWSPVEFDETLPGCVCGCEITAEYPAHWTSPSTGKHGYSGVLRGAAWCCTRTCSYTLQGRYTCMCQGTWLWAQGFKTWVCLCVCRTCVARPSCLQPGGLQWQRTGRVWGTAAANQHMAVADEVAAGGGAVRRCTPAEQQEMHSWRLTHTESRVQPGSCP
jgi:hypothetical protein